MLVIARLGSLQVVLRGLLKEARERRTRVQERKDPRERVVKVAIKLLEAYAEDVVPSVCPCRAARTLRFRATLASTWQGFDSRVRGAWMEGSSARL